MFPTVVKAIIIAVPSILLGLAVIATQKTKTGLVSRALYYLGAMLMIVLIPLMITQLIGVSTTDTRTDLTTGCVVATVSFWVSWMIAYLVYFRRTLRQN